MCLRSALSQSQCKKIAVAARRTATRLVPQLRTLASATSSPSVQMVDQPANGAATGSPELAAEVEALKKQLAHLEVRWCRCRGVRATYPYHLS